MSDSQGQPSRPKPDSEPVEPVTIRPQPPPYRPDRSLIGYIERGQSAPDDIRKREQ